ncbi:hypothetical protein D3C75_1281190 [compost metagenome]
MPNSVPSASANRWLSESCTNSTGSLAFRVDTLGKAFSRGVNRDWDGGGNYAGAIVKRKPVNRTQFTSAV